MMYCDAHIHLAELPKVDAKTLCVGNSFFCACAHSPDHFTTIENFFLHRKFVRSFGVHPQNPNPLLLPFLLSLLEDNRLDAIGEAGFDLFTSEYAAQIEAQESVWKIQVEYAAAFQKTLVVHCRNALNLIFRDAKLLKPLSSVIFHSWAGSPQEGMAILNRGINAFFSLGKPLLNGNKRALRSALELPVERILAETDAPYQTLKGEPYTKPQDIASVYAKLGELRGIPPEKFEELLKENFRAAFCLDQ